jgi:hypothetical protein
MPDPEIVMSPLCREITGDSTKIQVDIYRGEYESGWILVVIDEENASAVWDEPFASGQEALDAVMASPKPCTEPITIGQHGSFPVISHPSRDTNQIQTCQL